MTVDIIHADAREGLARFPDGHFHACVTSPPYWGLRDYGLGPDSLGLEPTPELYVEHLVSVMREVRRTLRHDGTLWLNLGDSYSAASTHGGGDKVGPLDSQATTKANRQYRSDGLKPKDLVGIPWMVAFALRADGWWLRSDIVWSKPNPMPESVTDRPTRSHEYLFLLTKSARYAYDQDAIREPGSVNIPWNVNTSNRGTKIDDSRNDGETNERLGKPAVAAGRNRRSVWEIATQPYPDAHFATFPEKLVEPCILTTSEWGCCPECGAPWERVVEKGAVPHDAEAKYPVGAGERMGKARDALRARGNSHDNPFEPVKTVGWDPACDCLTMDERTMVVPSPVPCRVLDPFAGSGTVGLVAERLGRHSVLIDAKEEYCEMARHRTAQMGLMAAP